MKTSRNILLLLVCLIASVSCVHKKKPKRVPPGICCLSQGTLVRLSNGKDILIENLKAGDTVLAFDKKTNLFVPSRVQKTFYTEHAGFFKINFSALVRNDVEVYPALSITVSQDHPIWVKDKGWCSLQPEVTKRILMMKDVTKLAVGDACYTNKDGSKEGYAGVATIASIEPVKEVVRAYTIVRLENGLDCFVANGIVVGTEAISAQEAAD